MNTMNDMSVLIVAGGTGGHISPGIALYEEFRENGMRTLFLTGKRDERFSSLREVAPDDMKLYRAPSFSKNPAKIFVFPSLFTGAVLVARTIIRRNGVRAVIGMGGYVSAPALVAAKLMKVPLFLCEQNSVPGKVTKFFEKHARKIYGTFQDTTRYLKCTARYVRAGNPIRKKVLVDAAREEARKAFHLMHSKKVILVIGGSQGAVRLNELVFGLKKEYSDELKNVGIIWSTGDLSYKKYKEKIHNEIDEGSIYLSPFVERVGLAYRAADLAIARSGAGVMMELAAMGVPSIQIPYPHAADNHQDKNADEFVRAGAAIKIGNEDAVPEKVMPVIQDLLNNPRALQRMSERALAAALPNAAEVIVTGILSELNEDAQPPLP
ncbi:MAG: undecaprenyldiphospho-muramoylpentapeptide beta-N-acetylglucosaminyltransferase [Spirochaetes bacterium RBG_13_51_14]|nr:MAG: undecaprenyldiphospho-muramoylpentapeptide beta-N-acetylglucosaminyltransferase [Spirochaetes bacterium RBG_13_51_14]